MWIRRNRAGARWHRVESTIEDRKVTRCGRQMHDVDNAGRGIETWNLLDGASLNVCRYCG